VASRRLQNEGDIEPFDAVGGPATATYAAANRLGWQMVGARAFKEPNGHVLDVAVEAPATIKKAAMEAFEDWAASRSSLADQIGGPPFLEPLKDFCDRKGTPAATKGSLRSMAEGGWPSQASLFAAGLSDSPLCQLCHREPGTFYHKVRTCLGTQHFRTGAWARRAGLCSSGQGTAEETATPLLRRGIAVAPPRAPPPEALEDFKKGDPEVEKGEAVFTGRAATDGSMIDVKPARARRAGWSGVCTTEEGELRFAFYGTCADRCPTAHRAEIHAILGVLRRARFPLTLYTDHKSAVTAWERGREYCCDSSRAAADIWREIWGLFDKLQGDMVEALPVEAFRLIWVKSHTGVEAVSAGRMDPAIQKLNALADHYAGEGSAWARDLVPNEGQVAVYQTAKAFYQVLGAICKEWPVDYVQDRLKPAPDPARGRAPAWAVHPSRPHEPWRTLGGFGVCARCKTRSRVSCGGQLRIFFRSPCRAGGAEADAALSQAGRLSLLALREEMVGQGAVQLACVASKGKGVAIGGGSKKSRQGLVPSAPGGGRLGGPACSTTCRYSTPEHLL